MNERQSELARVHIWVKGRVQGVGFRMYVQESALIIGVTGWVRNVGWDTVEAVAEGTSEKLERFVEMIKRGPPGSHVVDSRLEWEDVTGEYVDFGVRRSL